MWYELLCLCVVTQSCPTLCDPVDHSPPGSPIPGILQARTLEWAAISSSRSSCQPRDQASSPALAGRFFTTEPLGKARCCVRWVIKGTCGKGHLRALESHGWGKETSSDIFVNPKFYPSGNICRAKPKTPSSLSSQAWSRGDLVARYCRERHF